MPYISKDVQKFKLNSMRTTVVFLVVLGTLLGLGVYFQLRRDKKLEHSKQTVAVITWCGKAINGGAKISFYLNGNRINASILNGNYRDYSIGDSILIKYVVEDPELVEVVDKYYMKKYQH